MVWGTYLEKNCQSSNGHLLGSGGVKMLARMVWGTYAVKIELQIGICLCLIRKVLRLAMKLCGTYVLSK